MMITGCLMDEETQICEENGPIVKITTTGSENDDDCFIAGAMTPKLKLF
jgi:hypothetical protein